MPLTDVQIKAAKPDAKLRKLSDGGGLQLWVFPDGARRWRLDYRLNGKRKVFAIGVYPETALKAAREAAVRARETIASGMDPVVRRKTDRQLRAISNANSFNVLADELIEKKRREHKAEATISKLQWLFELVRPTLGSRPITEITPAEVLAAIRPVEAKGLHETAVRLRGRIGEVFRYAIATDRCETDPTAALRGALIRPKVKHRSALTEPKAFGELLRAINGYEGAPETRIALQLLALTFVRPGELRHAEWPEFDFDAAVWNIPPGRMKMRRPHRVPLSTPALELLRQLKLLSGHGRYLFPSERTVLRPMSENTTNAALRRLGYSGEEMSSHGFRAAASSMLNESGLWNPDAIERQLAHADEDEVRKAYARARYWDERVRMMAWWSDRCDEMRGGLPRKIVPFQASA
jgi:integrase